MTKPARKAAIRAAVTRAGRNSQGRGESDRAGRKLVAPKMDAKGRYAAATVLLAATLGVDADWLYRVWIQLALMRRYEQGLPQAAAEDGAWRDVRAMLEKDGEEAN